MKTNSRLEQSVWIMMLPVAALACYMLDKAGWGCLLFTLLCIFARIFKPRNVKHARRMTYLIQLLAVVILALQASLRDWITMLFVLLLVAQALTLYQLHQVRSLYTLLWVGFFTSALVMMQYNQIHHSLLILALNCVSIYSLYHYHCGHSALIKKKNLKPFIALLAACLPLAALLFIFIPRLPALWKMPQVGSQTVGLQEHIKPGELANLSQSGGLAFRVEFDGPRPPQAQLYWRAFTLDEFNGEQWQQSRLLKQVQRQVKTGQLNFSARLTGLNLINYQVIAQASMQNWLFALDRAYSTSDQVAQMPDYSLLATEVVDKKKRYQVQTALNQPLTKSYFKPEHFLQLPANGNPKTRQLVVQLQQSYPNNSDLVRAMLTHFATQGFVYSLSTPNLAEDPIDGFLFASKVGFCGHYASALTYMLRLAQIPARVVVGYQGGEYNPTADYFSVYQSSAHAWVEAWTGQQWQRLDPTAMVSPERLTLSLEDVLGAEQVYAEQGFTVRRFDDWPAVRSMRLWFASIDYYWTRWVLNYDQQSQQSLWQQLTGQQPLLKAALTGFIILLILLLSWFLGRLLSRYHNNSDPALKLFTKIQTATLKKGGESYQQVTPRKLLQQHDNMPPQIKGLLLEFANCWDTYWYAPITIKQKKVQLKKMTIIADNIVRKIKTTKNLV